MSITNTFKTTYFAKSSRCSWCKRTQNPHPDFIEPIPIKRINLGKNLAVSLCLSCFESELKDAAFSDKALLQQLKGKLKLLKLINLNS